MARVRPHHPGPVGRSETVLSPCGYLRRRVRRRSTSCTSATTHVICCWEVDGVLVDPGPQSLRGDAARRARRRAPARLLLTHIHFDHAGAAGALVRRWPDLPVYVHERGAPHLADPAKLVASAARLYGGEEGCAAVGRGRAGAGGEPARARGRRDGRRGRLPRRVHARPRLPPRLLPARADAAWRSSATWPACASRPSRSRSRRRRRPTSTSRRGSARSTRSPAGSPRRSASPTSGRSTTRPTQLERVRESLHEQAELARRARRGRLRRGLLARVHERAGEAADAILQAAPPDQLYLGLERYLKQGRAGILRL